MPASALHAVVRPRRQAGHRSKETWDPLLGRRLLIMSVGTIRRAS